MLLPDENKSALETETDTFYIIQKFEFDRKLQLETSH